MKKGVIFLNLSRGIVVDYKALAKNLNSRKIRGAAIDVFENEPEKNGNVFESPLKNLKNVILTPHIGGSTEEAQKAIGEYVSERIVKNFL
jgi:D-3-phosphoglycerate dehydrogenase / 2-oxoglutarate reductase